MEQITENSYYQYFIGLPGVSNEAPYVFSLLVEFRAKLDLSIDENGMARLERLSFDAYNESDVLTGPSKDIRNGPDIIHRGYLRTGTTGTGRIFRSAGSMAFGYPDRCWEDQVRCHG